MARSAVVIDPEYLKHEPGEFHPEKPERIRALLDLTEKLDRDKFQSLAAQGRNPIGHRILPRTRLRRPG